MNQTDRIRTDAPRFENHSGQRPTARQWAQVRRQLGEVAICHACQRPGATGRGIDGELYHGRCTRYQAREAQP